ncbi:Coiled-coil domain-containing protein 42A [Echinococcus granulosus]|uniref:Coiled coil domain containing protein 42 n=1 Tax=Echinococcus granulosus TaxID=6210 RepID=U6J589_ECHGR|nr:Coiled-coil domain-containing protein 42A [Echinococcus granulosus]EUB62660.1 Coiled-coil domain-containing protein 42A [Echinococcus granulosus]CDS19185.1 coiled coil domain containing protein 42 [Echinococcus granulosus]
MAEWFHSICGHTKMALNSSANTHPSKFIESLTYESKLLKSGNGTAPENSMMNLANSDRRLLEMRKKFRSEIAESKKKREDLAVRQEDLRYQMKRFEGFIRDNEAKRIRAVKKYLTERQIIEEKTKEGVELRVEFGKAKIAYEDMRRKVEEYKKYESYLLDVIDLLPPDYIKIADNVLVGLIMRYNTLYGTYQSLLAEMNTKSKNIREAHTHLQALREEHASRILTLNSKLADLYKERAANNEQLQQLVQKFDQGHKDLRKQLELFGTVIRSVDNLVDKCGWPYTTAVEENETLCTKLVRITEYIVTVRMILAAINANSGKAERKQPPKNRGATPE